MNPGASSPGNPHRRRRVPTALAARWVSATLLGALLTTTATAVTELQRSDPLPPVTARTIDGRPVDTGQMRGETVIVLFGEAGQENTHAACELVLAILGDPQLAEEKIRWILVLSRHSDIKLLGSGLQDTGHSPLIVHDSERTVFGAYKVAVVPSVVVADKEGRVVHALAGLTTRFGDIVSDAVLLSAGRIDPERFERALHPPAGADPDENKLRAERLIRLARQLQRRGMHDAAADRYREALKLAPESEAARLALAGVLHEDGKLDEAEALCRAALAANPNSLDAALELAFVCLSRGAEQRDEAEALVCDVLQRSPRRARAHYLMGRIREEQGQLERAAAGYRRATELLLEERDGGTSH